MENNRENAQTLVIGSLLLLALAVSLIIYTQIAIFPQINERTEFSELKDSTESMKNIESEISTVATVGGSKSVEFDNKISYVPQPAGPPDQFGQLNTRGTEPIELRNKDSAVSFLFGNKFGPSGPPPENRYHKIISYQPRLIELSSTGRRIVYDNTVVGVTESSQDGFTTVSNQNIIKDDTINVFHLVSSEESGFKSPEEELSFTRVESGRNTIEPNSANSDPIELEFSTSYSENTWDSLLENQLVANGGNVENVDKSGDRVTIELSRTPAGGEYNLNYARILVD